MHVLARRSTCEVWVYVFAEGSITQYELDHRVIACVEICSCCTRDPLSQLHLAALLFLRGHEHGSLALLPTYAGSLQNEPLFLRTYTDAEGEEEEDANLRLHNIVHSSLDVVGERKGTRWSLRISCSPVLRQLPLPNSTLLSVCKRLSACTCTVYPIQAGVVASAGR